TVHFASSDGSATLPGDATLTAGVGTFTATFNTAGGQTLTATDTVSSSISGSTAVQVVPALATHFSVIAPASANAGSVVTYTISALDVFGNVATAYTGTVHFSSTDGSATLPSDVTLAGGVGTL